MLPFSKAIGICNFLVNIIFDFCSVQSPPYLIKQPPADEVLFMLEKDWSNDGSFWLDCVAEGAPNPM